MNDRPGANMDRPRPVYLRAGVKIVKLKSFLLRFPRFSADKFNVGMIMRRLLCQKPKLVH